MKFLKYLFLLIVVTSCKTKKINADSSIIKKAKAVHSRILTLDTHADINIANFTDKKNYSQKLENQVNLPNMEEGGLDAVFFIVYTKQGELNVKGYKEAYKNAISKFDAIHKLTKEIAPERIALALNSKEARDIYVSGKKVAMIGVENGYPIGTDVSRVKNFYDLGARYMSLSHQGHSQLCDSNTGEEDNVWLHNGVSDLGKEVIKEMNKWGMMIDVSHPSKKAMKDMIELSKAPIIASHSSARAVCNHSRNLDDEQLKWLKENGGVVQTVAFRGYVNIEKNDAYNEAVRLKAHELAKNSDFKILNRSSYLKLKTSERSEYLKQRRFYREQAKSEIDTTKFPPVDIADFVNHIDYLVKKIGINHVGISSDFDGGGGVEGWNDASETLNITIELVKRGYSEKEIEKLWSGNLLRVLDEVEAIAKKIQASGKM